MIGQSAVNNLRGNENSGRKSCEDPRALSIQKKLFSKSKFSVKGFKVDKRERNLSVHLANKPGNHINHIGHPKTTFGAFFNRYEGQNYEISEGFGTEEKLVKREYMSPQTKRRKSPTTREINFVECDKLFSEYNMEKISIEEPDIKNETFFSKNLGEATEKNYCDESVHNLDGVKISFKVNPAASELKLSNLNINIKKNKTLKNEVQNFDPYDVNGYNSSINSSKTVGKRELSPLKKEKTIIGECSKYIFTDNSKLFDKLNLTDTKNQEFLFQKYNFNCSLQCIVSLISISSVIIEYEINFRNNTLNNYNLISSNEPVKDPSKAHLNTLNLFALWMCLISSVLLWVLIIYDHLLNCKILYYNKKISESIWRTEPKLLRNLILTIIIFFLHPNPILKDIKVPLFNTKFEVTVYYSLNSIFGLVSLFRFWFFIKFFLVHSEYYSPRTQRVCEMNNFDTNLIYSMKANMVKVPYIAYLLFFLIIVVVCSFGLRIFERELDFYTENDFGSYWNVVWCLIITMTTVGYGDYYPTTLFGRIIGILSCICGVFLISMLIVTITNLLNFEGCENTVFLLLERIELIEEKDILAAKLVSRYLKLMKLLKKEKKSQLERRNTGVKLSSDNVIPWKKFIEYKDKLRDELLLNLLNFKEKCNEIKATYPLYSNFDNILDNLEQLDLGLDDLTHKYSQLQSENKS